MTLLDIVETDVGYNSAEAQQFGITAGACFNAVGGGAIDLIDLKVTGYTGDTAGDVTIQTLNEFGQTVTTFAWYDVEEEGYYGWYNYETEEELTKGEVTVQPGEGLWLYCAAEGYGLQSAGEVPLTADITVTLQQFGLSVANPTPVDADLLNTYISGYTGDVAGDVTVQTLNEFGQTVTTFAWYDVEEEGYYGWYNYETEEELTAGEVVAKPGIGLWVYCSADGYTFVWPKVSLTK